MLQRIGDLFLVTGIALLIWLYAEGQNIRTTDLTFVFQLSPAAGQQLLIEPRTNFSVDATLRCANSQINTVRQLARNPILVPVTASGEDLTRELDFARILAENPQLLGAGIEVVEVRPRTTSIQVQRLVEVPVPITVDTGSLNVAGPPTVEPASASVRIPEGLAPTARESQLVARLSELDLRDVQPNVLTERQVPLRLPPALQVANVTVLPSTATVSFTLRSDTYTLQTVPIHIQLPGNRTDTKVDLASDLPVLNDVQITGPAELIERIRKPEGPDKIEVVAILRLTQEEIDQPITSKQVYIDLPAGVSVTSEIPRISFTITRE